MKDPIHAHLSLLSREKFKVLVAGFSPRRPRFDTNAVVEKIVVGYVCLRSRQFYLIGDCLPILHIYIHLLPTLYVLDQECPTGGGICKFIWVGGGVGGNRMWRFSHRCFDYVEYEKPKNSSSKMPLNICLLLFKKFRLLVGPPGTKCIPLIMILH